MIWSSKPTESECRLEPALFTAASSTGLLWPLPELPHNFAGLWSYHVLSEGEFQTPQMFSACSPDVSSTGVRFTALCAPPGFWCEEICQKFVKINARFDVRINVGAQSRIYVRINVRT